MGPRALLHKNHTFPWEGMIMKKVVFCLVSIIFALCAFFSTASAEITKKDQDRAIRAVKKKFGQKTGIFMYMPDSGLKNVVTGKTEKESFNYMTPYTGVSSGGGQIGVVRLNSKSPKAVKYIYFVVHQERYREKFNANPDDLKVAEFKQDPEGRFLTMRNGGCCELRQIVMDATEKITDPDDKYMFYVVLRLPLPEKNQTKNGYYILQEWEVPHGFGEKEYYQPIIMVY